MNETEKPGQSVFELIEGLTEVDPEVVAAFERAMTQDVIPKVVEVVEERRLLAVQTRQLQIKS